jgi:hypothetical protein
VEAITLPGKHLECSCPGCKNHNSPYKVQYLYGNLIVMDAYCAKCIIQYWVKWDLFKIQLEQDEKEVEAIQEAIKLLDDSNRSERL